MSFPNDEIRQKIAEVVGTREGVAFVGSKQEVAEIRHRAWRDHNRVDFEFAAAPGLNVCVVKH